METYKHGIRIDWNDREHNVINERRCRIRVNGVVVEGFREKVGRSAAIIFDEDVIKVEIEAEGPNGPVPAKKGDFEPSGVCYEFRRPS